MTTPERVDPEVAAETFALHLSQFFAAGRAVLEDGWQRIDVDKLATVVALPAVRGDQTRDIYYVRLGAEYYDVWPPVVTFVYKDGEGHWLPALTGTRWWPNQQNSAGFPFALHLPYTYQDGSSRQLVCFSHSFDYYISGHNPTEAERWRQGTHTLAATLNRIAQALRAPNYIGPSGDNPP